MLARVTSLAWLTALMALACTDQVPTPDGVAPPSVGAAGAGVEPGAAGVGGQAGAAGLADGGLGGQADGGYLPPEEEEPVEENPVDEEPTDEEPVVEEPVEEEVGLPCDVAAVLRTRCQTCHANPPLGGANLSLLTHADLTAASKLDASVTVAARSLKRMRDTLLPMPPAPASRASSAELATLQAWLEAGTPRGKCDPDDEPIDPSSNPYDAPPFCSTGNYWPGLDSGSPWMMPGHACITCHRGTNGRAPRFTVAGTVFATAHEPDKCHGVSGALGATIVITDANGLVLPAIPVTSGGNFGAILSGLAVPYTAKLVVGDSERVMLTPQTDGDCNACHTQFGAQGALGRLILP